MKNKYSFILGTLLVFLLGNSVAFGQNQYYLELDASNTYIYYDDDLSLSKMDAAPDYTIEAWVFPISGRVNNLDVIIHRDECFSLVMYNASGSGDIEDFYFEVYDISISAWKTFHTSTDETLELDKWNHIAVINNSSTNTIKLFVNSTNVTAGSSYPAQTLRPAAANPSNLFIGAGGIASPNNSFGGYIDEVRLKNSAESINNLQGNGAVAEYISDANTAGLFHFNEGVGLESVNASTGVNASIVNAFYWRGWRYKPGHSIPLGPRFVWNGIYSKFSLYEGNWDMGIPERPTETDIVIVPSGTPYDLGFEESEGFTCSDFTIESGATVNINDDVTCTNLTIENNAVVYLEISLTVNGTFVNNSGISGLIIESDEWGGQGSLIHNTANVPATIKRYIEAYTPSDSDDGWHYLSSPVGDFTISGSDFEPGVNDDLFAYNDANGMWNNYYGTGFNQFKKGKGYLCSYQASVVHTFNQNAININDVSFNNIGSVTGWELLGNPFSCALNWNSGSWNKSNINGAQIYDESMRNWVPAGIIPANNGFFVEVTNPINHITIPAEARLHDWQSWYKGQEANDNKLEIKIIGDQDKGWDYTTIAFNDAASEAYDPEYDYHKLFGQASAPQLYTLNQNQDEFCVNTLPIPNDEKILPLQIRIGYTGEYLIVIKENTIELEGNIYLEDLKTGILTNLSATPTYIFQGEKGENANRFMLHFNSTTGINNINNASNVHIYFNAQSIYLSSEKSITGELNIFNTGGRLVYSQQLLNSNMHRVSVPSLKGVYLIQLITNENIFTQKVIIQ